MITPGKLSLHHLKYGKKKRRILPLEPIFLVGKVIFQFDFVICPDIIKTRGGAAW
jgi:hypothetical protein